MKSTGLNGVFFDKGFLWTQNRAPGTKIYGELLRERGPHEYRSWNPRRSKMGALATNKPDTPWIGPDDDVLYLGAASGTTVSHISDITDGTLYAVEFSPRSTRDLLWNMEPRDNVVVIHEDASEPDAYGAYIGGYVDALVQDVAQRHQVEIFLRNLQFLRPGGLGFLMVKARSISVSAPVKQIYDDVLAALREAGLKVRANIDLGPHEVDHRAIIVEKPGAGA